MKKVRIGCGSGCCKDRIEPVEEMLQHGKLDYLVFETLAERSFANLQLQKKLDPDKGFNEMLEARMRRSLKQCVEQNIKIITNMGGANPSGAASIVAKIAKELDLSIKIATVEGDDIFSNLDTYMGNERWQHPNESLKGLDGEIYYANVYLGGLPIKEALENGADLIITGRIADAALFYGPLMYEFDWNVNSPHMGQAVLAGHLLECCGQITGGFFAEPDIKEVPNLEKIGFPIGEVYKNGSFTISKVKNSGGLINIQTCKEQLFYEIENPACYKTPDAIVDFSNVKFEEIEQNLIRVTGATSNGKPDSLKANVGCLNGFIATGIVGFSGSKSLKLASLCSEIIEKRLDIIGLKPVKLQTDYMGYNSLCKTELADDLNEKTYNEILLRMCARTKTREEACLFADEFGFLYTNGPSSSTAINTDIKPSLLVTSIFVPREDVHASIRYEEV